MPGVHIDRINQVALILKDAEQPLKKRFRALFTLRNYGGTTSIEAINEVVQHDPSALLKHECCYCLGQMADPLAICHLTRVLADQRENEVVRHEAGEALGNLATDQDPELIKLLRNNLNDSSPIVAQTCELALDLIQWKADTHGDEQRGLARLNPYSSQDPAPSFRLDDPPVDQLNKILLDSQSTLFDKYRALFTLRNRGDEQSIRVLGEALVFYLDQDLMSLFKHEIGYIFGQMQSPQSIPYLKKALDCVREHEIVRHEAAEALGSVATLESLEILKPFLNDEAVLVRNSVEVALDMIDYENDADQFDFLSWVLDICVKIRLLNVYVYTLVSAQLLFLFAF